MNKLLICILLVPLFVNNGRAQKNNSLEIALSIHQFELEYQHKIFSENFSAGAFIGVGNQDINSSFDDFLTGVKMGYNIFSNPKNNLDVQVKLGIYIPNNDYYNAITPTTQAGMKYSRIIGKSKRHSLIINTGYRYGKRDYKQHYSSELLKISTIGTFKLSPLYFSIGYGFRF